MTSIELQKNTNSHHEIEVDKQPKTQKDLEVQFDNKSDSKEDEIYSQDSYKNFEL